MFVAELMKSICQTIIVSTQGLKRCSFLPKWSVYKHIKFFDMSKDYTTCSLEYEQTKKDAKIL